MSHYIKHTLFLKTPGMKNPEKVNNDDIIEIYNNIETLTGEQLPETNIEEMTLIVFNVLSSEMGFTL